MNVHCTCTCTPEKVVEAVIHCSSLLPPSNLCGTGCQISRHGGLGVLVQEVLLVRLFVVHFSLADLAHWLGSLGSLLAALVLNNLLVITHLVISENIYY